MGQETEGSYSRLRGTKKTFKKLQHDNNKSHSYKKWWNFDVNRW